ncbi:helix-turn-helix domain-containing protein [Actinomadura harenae]|uniref:Helix-turn-helix domain-containing protein n=1 Tax=Actinomadura harenae TaxID=2483351 RepID=A0A3M2LT81_9ACTN|nr:RodZ domain-containing protein [Actinomadura harenae]RMI39245.1 helix-turn-helix domain-containing protein [Actinomadura harenae]
MSIGETLAREREQAGLTLTEVSLRTRVRESVVRAIEHDDFSPCGGNFYARGHIRSIARVIGIDPEPLVQEFDEAHGGAPQPASAVAVFEPDQQVALRGRRSPNWTAAMALALVLVVGYGIFQVLHRGGGEHHAAQQVAGTPAPPKPSMPAAGPSTASPSPSGKPHKGVQVRLKARRATWVDVRGDKGRSLYTGTLAAGAARHWSAHKVISIVIGNGGTVRLTVNGQDIGSPGTDGNVMTLKFTPADPKPQDRQPT